MGLFKALQCHFLTISQTLFPKIHFAFCSVDVESETADFGGVAQAFSKLLGEYEELEKQNSINN